MPNLKIESYSNFLRERGVIPSEKKILIAQLSESEQEKDLTVPVNCGGYGRIRHFRIYKHPGWSPDTLPNFPAAKALECSPDIVLRTQVFQLSACDFRCWYCFVDYNRLSANLKFSKYFTADELLDMFIKQENRPNVIDLSGGQPDLVPEWTLWTMEALQRRGLNNEIFLWSDDNLSSHNFWKFITKKQRKYVVRYKKYSRVGCFKGYDESSFSFNTHAPPELFIQQFEIYKDLLKEGFDMYAYVTFTAIPHDRLRSSMVRFVDKLQKIHPNLPLRTIPLKIEIFTPAKNRVKQDHERSLMFQYEVHNTWLEELGNRFSQTERNIPISDVSMEI